MSNGITAELSELIALRRYACSASYEPEQRTLRSGNHLSKLRGRGMDFAEVRNYQAGDEVRHMEWRITARTGKPHVKLFQEERERPTILLTDFNPTMYFGTRIAFKSVIAAKLAAIIAWTVVAQGDRIGGLLFSETQHNEFLPKGHEAGVLPFLAALSRYTQSPNRMAQHTVKTKPLSEALIRLRRVTRPGSILVLISDFYSLDAESEQHLSRLRAHNDVLAYHVCDSIELNAPKPQQYAITNGQQEMILDTTQPAVVKAYEQHFHQQADALQALMQRNRIQYVQVTSETDLPLLLRQTFPRRTVRG